MTNSGTGKTYASAFAMRQLAKQTKHSYERVFDNRISIGLVGAGYLPVYSSIAWTPWGRGVDNTNINNIYFISNTYSSNF